ncbi:MAG: 2Fe-2S iron-sulfur cluster-binding protein [Planktomarina sp.]|jgi:ferredoxin|nr:2Fe-2S iron-sulfur cluster-binding protein [Planktomarina sp.]|tara:strand:- start:3174 stop:3548 length:375 start_codon:yes stop_codon:yes gene_type:complete
MPGRKIKHKVTLQNRQNKTLEVSENEAILDVFEASGWVLPVACRYGGCITCAAKMISGSVRQPKGTAINKRQSQDGYVLLCVARPKEDCVFDVGVESHNTLYQNPFSSNGAASLLEKAKTKAGG